MAPSVTVALCPSCIAQLPPSYGPDRASRLQRAWGAGCPTAPKARTHPTSRGSAGTSVPASLADSFSLQPVWAGGHPALLGNQLFRIKGCLAGINWNFWGLALQPILVNIHRKSTSISDNGYPLLAKSCLWDVKRKRSPKFNRNNKIFSQSLLWETAELLWLRAVVSFQTTNNNKGTFSKRQTPS